MNEGQRFRSIVGTLFLFLLALSFLSAAPRAELLWVAHGGPSQSLDWTIDVCVAPDGKIWVADISDRFFIFNPQGELIETWGKSGTGPGEFRFYRPRDTTSNFWLSADLLFLPDGSFLVSDFLNHRIQHFDSQRNFIGLWGPEDLLPVQLILSPSGEVIASFMSHHDIYRYDLQGRALGVLDLGETLYGSLASEPRGLGGIGMDKAGHIMVSETRKNHIFVFDTSGKESGRIGELDRTVYGGLKASWEKLEDVNGNIVVADSDNHRVVVFDKSGRFAFDFGGYGAGDGDFRFVASIALDGLGNIYVADEVGKALKKYALIGMPSENPVPGAKRPLD